MRGLPRGPRGGAAIDSMSTVLLILAGGPPGPPKILRGLPRGPHGGAAMRLSESVRGPNEPPLSHGRRKRQPTQDGASASPRAHTVRYCAGRRKRRTAIAQDSASASPRPRRTAQAPVRDCTGGASANPRVPATTATTATGRPQPGFSRLARGACPKGGRASAAGKRQKSRKTHRKTGGRQRKKAGKGGARKKEEDEPKPESHSQQESKIRRGGDEGRHLDLWHSFRRSNSVRGLYMLKAHVLTELACAVHNQQY